MPIQPGATLEAFRRHLNKSGTGPDPELEAHLIAATSIAENHPEHGIGPIVNRTVTAYAPYTHDVGMVLPEGPIVSIETLEGDTASYVSADVRYSTAGVVRPIYGGTIARGDYLVTYTAGWAATTEDVPDDIQLAVCIIGKHLWRTQRAPVGAPRAGAADEENVPLGFLIPHRAASILDGRRPYAVAFS
jgi:hypothetical protein